MKMNEMKEKEWMSDDDVLKEVFGKAESVAEFTGYGMVCLPKKKLQEILGKFSTFEEAHQYLNELAQRHANIEKLKMRTETRFKRFQTLNEGSRLIFHAAFMEPELGEMHYISNLSETTSNEMAELLFRNCQMSCVYRDAVVKAYQLCKKAGIEDGDIKKSFV